MNETNNGMIRENKDHKPHPMDYTTLENERRYWAHMKKGEEKHGRGNWIKGGMSLRDWCESAQRHLQAMKYIAEGKPVPEELGGDNEDHPAALRFNAEGFMNEQIIRAEPEYHYPITESLVDE